MDAILFDAGLTLLRSATPTARMAQQVMAARGISVDRKALESAMSRSEAHLEQRWHRGDWWATESQVRRLFLEAYAVGLSRPEILGDADDRIETLAGAMYDAYADAAHWALYPDVRPTLDRLHEAGLVMGVVSDWGHGLEALLLELGLAEDLAFVVVSSRLGISKPDPTVFHMALDRIGVSADRALYVGDTYVKDVLGARAAGIRPVLLDRQNRVPRADCEVIGDLRELIPLAL